jgi:porin
MKTGNPVKRRETVFELTYRTRLAPWLALQPDAQYIIDPGTDPALGNALAVGLRFEIGWGTGAS